MAPVRAGDMKDSLASLENRESLGIALRRASVGIKETVQWHLAEIR